MLFLFIVVMSVVNVDNSVCNPEVLAIVKSPSFMFFCFPSNSVCNPAVLAMVKSPSFIVFCFPSNVVCNPDVLANVFH